LAVSVLRLALHQSSPKTDSRRWVVLDAGAVAVAVALLRIAAIITPTIIILLPPTPLVAQEGRVVDLRLPLLLLLLLLLPPLPPLPPQPPPPREQMMCLSHRLLRRRPLSQSSALRRFALASMWKIVCLPV
jgi:hypothetical protein